MFVANLSVCPWKAFPAYIIFVGKARSLPWSGTHETWFSRLGSGHTHKHKTKLERLARDEYSKLLQTGTTSLIVYIYQKRYKFKKHIL